MRDGERVTGGERRETRDKRQSRKQRKIQETSGQRREKDTVQETRDEIIPKFLLYSIMSTKF